MAVVENEEEEKSKKMFYNKEILVYDYIVENCKPCESAKQVVVSEQNNSFSAFFSLL